jgi:hypothetical protein
VRGHISSETRAKRDKQGEDTGGRETNCMCLVTKKETVVVFFF